MQSVGDESFWWCTFWFRKYSGDGGLNVIVGTEYSTNISWKDFHVSVGRSRIRLGSKKLLYRERLVTFNWNCSWKVQFLAKLISASVRSGAVLVVCTIMQLESFALRILASKKFIIKKERKKVALYIQTSELLIKQKFMIRALVSSN